MFLDELEELSPKMPVKLLRVLEDGEYTPVGGVIGKKSHARIIAATNKNLKNLLQRGQIRPE